MAGINEPEYSHINEIRLLTNIDLFSNVIDLLVCKTNILLTTMYVSANIFASIDENLMGSFM